MLTYKNVNRVTILLLLVFILLRVLFFVSFLWIVVLGLTWLIITAIGSFNIKFNYFLNARLNNYKVKENVVSLTFDDGPNAEFTPKVLRLLKQHNAKATFFLVGKNIEHHPELLQEIIKQGHTIGNHTYRHSNNYGFLKTEEVISDLKKTTLLVAELTGLKMNFFRPAFGVTNPRISRAAQVLKLITIGWSVRSLDTTKDTEKRILERVTRTIKKGDIILFHDASQKTIEVLEQLLVFLEKKKLQSVTVNKLLDIEPYV